MNGDGGNQALLEFPCEFPIKVMGRDDPEFQETALDIVARHAGSIDAGAVRVVPSRNGNFVSVTITITAVSREQLDDIYRDLCRHERVLVAL